MTEKSIISPGDPGWLELKRLRAAVEDAIEEAIEEDGLSFEQALFAVIQTVGEAVHERGPADRLHEPRDDLGNLLAESISDGAALGSGRH